MADKHLDYGGGMFFCNVFEIQGEYCISVKKNEK
jgi:hypothetical protein